MIIKEIKCKSLINKSGLSDYCINPYTGCSNNCVYCYARFMLRYTNHKEEWGEFVDVKINAIEILKKELRNKKPGSVFISSVTDAYQGIEKKYEITRKILEILPKTFTPIILTKSALVKRDADLIKKFKKAEVGITITTLKEWKKFEPGASPPEERIKALKGMHEAGINTYVFLGPVIPYMTEKELEDIMEKIKFADKIWVDKLNIKSGNWQRIKKLVEKEYPNLHEEFNKAVFSEEYYSGFKRKISKLNKNLTFCY